MSIKNSAGMLRVHRHCGISFPSTLNYTPQRAERQQSRPVHPVLPTAKQVRHGGPCKLRRQLPSWRSGTMRQGCAGHALHRALRNIMRRNAVVRKQLSIHVQQSGVRHWLSKYTSMTAIQRRPG